MKQITRKQFFQRFAGGLLALGATAIGKDVDKGEEVVVYADKIMPATGNTTIIGQNGNQSVLAITSSSTEPTWLEVSGTNMYGKHVTELVNIPSDGSSVATENIWGNK